MSDQAKSPSSIQPPGEDEAIPRFANGTTPEAPTRPRGLLIFGLLTFTVFGVLLLRVLNGGTPYVMMAGGYFPGWFMAAVTGALLAAITIVALRSFPLTRTAGTGLVYFNCTIIYAFLAWSLLFS